MTSRTAPDRAPSVGGGSGKGQQSAVSGLTVSTKITLVRVVLAPALLALIMLRQQVPHAQVWAAVCFLVASFTDFLDGYLARRWHQVTALGNFLDTTADKVLVMAALLGLLAVGRVDVWIAFVIVARELVVLGLRAGAAAASKTVISASWWGKVKFGAQVLGITLAILRPPVTLGPLLLDQWAMALVAVISVLSAGSYIAPFTNLVRS